MIRKVMLMVCLLSLFLIFGCQGEQKSVSPEKSLNLKQKAESAEQIVEAHDGCYHRMTTYVSPRDIATATNPGFEQ